MYFRFNLESSHKGRVLEMYFRFNLDSGHKGRNRSQQEIIMAWVLWANNIVHKSKISTKKLVLFLILFLSEYIKSSPGVFCRLCNYLCSGVSDIRLQDQERSHFTPVAMFTLHTSGHVHTINGLNRRIILILQSIQAVKYKLCIKKSN